MARPLSRTAIFEAGISFAISRLIVAQGSSEVARSGWVVFTTRRRLRAKQSRNSRSDSGAIKSSRRRIIFDGASPTKHKCLAETGHYTVGDVITERRINS